MSCSWSQHSAARLETATPRSEIEHSTTEPHVNLTASLSQPTYRSIEQLRMHVNSDACWVIVHAFVPLH